MIDYCVVVLLISQLLDIIIALAASRQHIKHYHITTLCRTSKANWRDNEIFDESRFEKPQKMKVGLLVTKRQSTLQ